MLLGVGQRYLGLVAQCQGFAGLNGREGGVGHGQ